MKKKRYIAGILLLAASISLPAQELLELKQCRELALRHNKEIAASIKQTEGAVYTVRSYRGNFFPNFTATGTGLYSTADGKYASGSGNLPTFLPDAAGQFQSNGGFAFFPGLDLHLKVGTLYMAGVQVEQPLYRGGQISAAYRMAVIGRDMARANERLTATEVIRQTDEAYASVVKAQEMKKVADAYHTVLTELLRNVESARRHGLKAQNDVLKVQVRLNESELSQQKAANALRLATMNLCHYIGKPLTTEVRVADDFPEIEPITSLQTGDVSARPEYLILSKQVDMAGQQVKLNRSELLPKVGVQGSYSYAHGIELNDRTLLDKGSFSVVLNVSVPLFHFGERSNKVRAAKAKLEQTRLEQADRNEQMLLELTQAANNLDESRLENELSDRSLQQAEENMCVSKSHYDAGLETLSDYLEAQALWQQAYATRVESRFRLYLSHIAYLKAAGKLTPFPSSERETH